MLFTVFFFIFTVLNSRFNENYMKTSQTEIQNEKALSKREVKSKREVHFIIAYQTLLFGEFYQQLLPRQKLPERERTSRLV